jgi:hypothetical protein
MKKSALVISLLLPACALFAQGPRGSGGFGPMGGRGAGMFGGPQGGFVTGAPYSGVEVVQRQEALADGNTITTKHQTNVFRDGVGRLRTEETITPSASSGKQPYTQVTILDYVGGNRYLLDSSTMTAYQSPLRTPPARSGAAGAGKTMPRVATPGSGANAPQVVRTTLAPQAVNGLLSTGAHHVETIAAGQIGNERPIQIQRTVWVSNDLKVPVQIKSSDPRFGTTVMDLTNVVQSEPSPSLFMVPAGYTLKTGGGRGFGGPGGGPGGPALDLRCAAPDRRRSKRSGYFMAADVFSCLRHQPQSVFSVNLHDIPLAVTLFQQCPRQFRPFVHAVEFIGHALCTPSKSLPSPTWSIPAIATTWSMCFTTSARVAWMFGSAGVLAARNAFIIPSVSSAYLARMSARTGRSFSVWAASEVAAPRFKNPQSKSI